MKAFLVSVIIPNYNHALYLKQRIDSVLAQTYPDFEVIILDDCSTDNSRDVIESFRNRAQVSHIAFNDQNSGNTFKQWAKGLSLAQGEYIWIAESDDSCHPDFLQTLVTALDQHPEVVLAFADSYRMDSAGNLHEPWTSRYHGTELAVLRSDFRLPGRELVNGPMLYLNAVPNASGVVFRKSAALRVSMPPTRFRLVGDWYFWTQLMIQGEVFFTTQLLNYFRFHDNTVRKTTQKQGKGLLETLNLIESIKNTQRIDEQTERNSLNFLLYTWNNVVKETPLSLKIQLQVYQKILQLYPDYKLAATKELLTLLFSKNKR